ncbi:hypothetical protein [Clostridium transplantifaecale]|uniref:hypothetical protein n=1 Tax=Clostridium transplantifaecale TaxID=2479838 RepID=UPI000F6419C9|nr:hypothetical protein [Clostridium transplantifaecale]
MKLKKTVVLIAAGVLLMNAIPCYAASGEGVKTKVASVSVTDGANYSQIPDAETLQRDVGFVPKSPDTLAGDYKFTSGAITESYDLDSSGNLVNPKKGINYKYVNSTTGKTVSLSSELKSERSAPENSVVTKYGETELYFNNQYANYLGWFDHDIFYSLMDINKLVTQEEMTAIAKEIIDRNTEEAAVSLR